MISYFLQDAIDKIETHQQDMHDTSTEDHQEIDRVVSAMKRLQTRLDTPPEERVAQGEPIMFRRGSFPVKDLVRVEIPSNPVVLKSGGPMMSVISEAGDGILCEWGGGKFGKIGRSVFPEVVLYKLVDYQAASDKGA